MLGPRARAADLCEERGQLRVRETRVGSLSCDHRCVLPSGCEVARRPLHVASAGPGAPLPPELRASELLASEGHPVGGPAVATGSGLRRGGCARVLPWPCVAPHPSTDALTARSSPRSSPQAQSSLQPQDAFCSRGSGPLACSPCFWEGLWPLFSPRARAGWAAREARGPCLHRRPRPGLDTQNSLQMNSARLPLGPGAVSPGHAGCCLWCPTVLGRSEVQRPEDVLAIFKL